MKYRHSEILASESIATAGTKTIDINVRDPISRISIIVKLTNANTNPVGHPAEVIKKIELLDGSDVLCSLTGSIASALSYYGTGKQAFGMLDYIVPEYCMWCIDIYFGRELWDPDLALDPLKFNNLQMRIAHDKALGGGVPVAGSMRVRADVFDEKAISPIGFLLSKEHYQFTQVADTVYYTDLPTDYPMRQLMFGCHNTTEGPEYNITSIKLSEDQDKHIIIEGDIEDLLLSHGSLYNPWVETMYGMLTTSARTFPATPTWERRIGSDQLEDSNSTIFNTGSAGQFLTILAEIACNFECVVVGKNPFGQFALPFGRKDVIEDWWDIQNVGNARFRLTCAAGPDVSETMKVVTQQMRRY